MKTYVITVKRKTVDMNDLKTVFGNYTMLFEASNVTEALDFLDRDIIKNRKYIDTYYIENIYSE